MAYPQPNSNAPALGGLDFFRLNTPSVSPGDIYESEQGALAFAIGPDSDISNVDIFYYDDASPTRMNTFQISPDRGFAGRINARVNENYPVINRPGRILIAPANAYNPAWRPVSGYTGIVEFIDPVLDVIQYFSAQPSLLPQRSDKSYVLQGTTPKAGDNTLDQAIVIPAYGRKYGSFQFWNNWGANVLLTVIGVSYGVGVTPTPNLYDTDYDKLLYTTTLDLSTTRRGEFTYVASEFGSFDAFCVRLASPTVNTARMGFSTHITLSDDAL